jgi:hypothetical protein
LFPFLVLNKIQELVNRRCAQSIQVVRWKYSILEDLVLNMSRFRKMLIKSC